MNLSISLVDYVYELVSGLRGTKDITFPYKFSRKGGKVHLSEIEQLMVLHEFLGNSADYLSATDGIDVHDGYRVFLAESIAKEAFVCTMSYDQPFNSDGYYRFVWKQVRSSP